MGQSAGKVRRNSSCAGPNNLPPLQFHQVHGDNIRISRDGSAARRYESFCRAITFSSRPVRLSERICVRFTEISNNWNGGIRFGFTSKDPAILEDSLPKYASPDLTSRTGFWAKALNEIYCEKDNVLFYYVNSAGEVVYGINGEEKDIILSGVDTRGLLWTLIDVYGNCTGIEFLDARIYMYQNIRHNRTNSDRSRLQLPSSIDSSIISSLQQEQQQPSCINEEVPLIRYNNNVRLMPLQFHATKGRNIQLSQDRFIASRIDTTICQGYVFVARPLKINEKYFVQILKNDPIYTGGALAFGLTSCNPSTLQAQDFPDDSDYLLDRPEYWVVHKDVAPLLERGDEISFLINSEGEVIVAKNQQEPVIMIHVDHSLQLWIFLDAFGSTQSVRVFKQISPSIIVAQNPCSSSTLQRSSPNNLHVNLPETVVLNSSNSHSPVNQISLNNNENTSLSREISSHQESSSNQLIDVQVQNSINDISGSTILVVSLPPSNSDDHFMPITDYDVTQAYHSTGCNPNMPSTSSGILVSNENIFHQIVSNETSEALNQQKFEITTVENKAECTICYENQIDSVLYMCGHMCMCYECAIEQFRGVGGGRCPLCRAVIRDVIRTYTT